MEYRRVLQPLQGLVMSLALTETISILREMTYKVHLVYF